MYQDRILLSSKDILEHECKFDTRGYRPQEVDKYLDVIIHDYVVIYPNTIVKKEKRTYRRQHTFKTRNKKTKNSNGSIKRCC